MFKRKILAELNSQFQVLKEAHQAIVIRGPRQVGKTTTALAFAKEHYQNVIYINFMDQITLKSVFSGDIVIDRIIRDLSAFFPDAKFVPYKTVIIFDEIQECADARTSIKAFELDGRFDIIATGSLLGIRGYNKHIGKGIPTGYEAFFYMSSLDFEEYLLAKGISEELISSMKGSLKALTPISQALHLKMLDYFREYIVIGGMPQAVSLFLKTNDINIVRQYQRNLLEQYKDDFGKHLDEEEREYTNTSELSRILAVYDSIPNQLAKENKKFQYSKIKHGARSSQYEDAINYLKESGLIKLCYNLESLNVPLKAYSNEKEFKIYIFDTGLFISMLDDDSAFNILNDNLGIYKGAIYENIVADGLSKNDVPLYYYSKNNSLKIDFIYKHQNEILPLEVKARDGNAKSLKFIMMNPDKYHVKNCIKLSSKNIGCSNNIINIPYYLTFMLR